VAGDVVYTPRPAQQVATRNVGSAVLENIGRFIALTLIGLLLVWVAPGWTRKLADTVQERPLPSLGWGFVALVAFIGAAIAVPVATVLLAIAFGVVTLGNRAGPIVAGGFAGEATL